MVRDLLLVAVVAFGFAPANQSAADDSLFDEPTLRRTTDGHQIEVQPHAVFLGRNLSSRNAGRILVVDVTMKNVSSAPVELNLAASLATLDGVERSAVDSLDKVRSAHFEYFDRTYRVSRDPESSESQWRIAEETSLDRKARKRRDAPRRRDRDRFIPDDAPLLDEPAVDEADDTLNLNELEAPAKRTVAAGESYRAALTFIGFPDGQTTPRLTLAWPKLDAPIDLVAWSSQRANVTSRRAGPKDCIGIIEIRGPLDRLGLAAVAGELDRLALANVRRSVLSFQDGSAISERLLAQWLRTSIVNPASAVITYRDIPALPTSMYELAVADEAEVLRPLVGREIGGTEGAISETEDQAVAIVAESFVSRLERDDVVEELKNGKNNGIKAALLSLAAYRLRPRDLALVLELADHPSAEIRIAAMSALSQFDDDRSIKRLLAGLKSDSPLVRRAAVEALLTIETDRPTPWKDTLAEAVQDDAVGMRLLAAEPVEAWRPVFEAAAASAADDLITVGAEGLINLGGEQARLVMLGAIQGKNGTIKQLVVQRLRQQDDIDWAIDAALESLEGGEIDEPILDLLLAKKPVQCLRPLLDRVASMPASQGIRAVRLIGALAGPEEEAELAGMVSTFEQNMAQTALDVLYQRNSPLRFQVTEELFDRVEKHRKRSLIALLGRDGSPEAESILCKQFIDSTDSRDWGLYKQQLQQFGGRQVLETLREVLQSGSDEKKVFAHDARQQLWMRSPAWRIVDKAVDLQQEHTLASFQKAETLFNQAIKIDPDNGLALTGRGMLYLQWPLPNGPRLQDALDDYRMAAEVAPGYASAPVGMALTYASLNQPEDAVAALETIPNWLRNQSNVDEYNVACAYGIMHAKLTAKPSLTDEELAQADKWKAAGLEVLQKAVNLGFCSGPRGGENLEHMQKDGDLLSLHGTEFDAIVKQAKQRDDG